MLRLYSTQGSCVRDIVEVVEHRWLGVACPDRMRLRLMVRRSACQRVLAVQFFSGFQTDFRLFWVHTDFITP